MPAIVYLRPGTDTSTCPFCGALTVPEKWEGKTVLTRCPGCKAFVWRWGRPQAPPIQYWIRGELVGTCCTCGEEIRGTNFGTGPREGQVWHETSLYEKATGKRGCAPVRNGKNIYAKCETRR